MSDRKPAFFVDVNFQHAIWLGFLLIAICSGAATASFERKVGSEISLGKNLVGEECRAVLERQKDKYDYTRHRVYCGAWDEPSATVNSWTFRKSNTNAWWRDRQDYWWRPYIDGKYICEAGEDSEILDAVHVATLDCTTRTGEFPYKAYVGKIDSRIFFVDYIPANANVVATLSGIVSDKISPQNIEIGSKSRLVAALQDQANNGGRIFYGAGAYGEFVASFELGRILNHAYEPRRAIAAFNRALEKHAEIFGPGAPSSGAILARIGNDYRNLGDYATSERYLDQAESLLAGTNDRNNQAEVLVYRSLLAAKHKQYEESVRFAQEAHDIRVSYWKKNNGWIAHAKYAVARALFESGDYDDADSYARDSVRIYDEIFGKYHHWPANVRLLLGRIATKLGDSDEAIAYISDAIDIRQALFGKTLPYATALWDRAETHADAGNLNAAIQDFTTAVHTVSESDLASRLERASLATDDIVDAIVSVLPALTEAESNRFASVFEAMQLPRRGVAKSVISQMAARVSAGNKETADLTRRLQDLSAAREDYRYKLGQLSGQEGDNGTSEKLASLSARLADVESEITEISGELQGRFPVYAKLIKPLPVDLSELSALLRPGEGLVRFMSGQDRTITLLTDGRKTFVNVAGFGREELETRIDAVRLSLDSGASEPFRMRESHDLFVQLFGELAVHLSGFDHVFFVPDGALASFPPSLFVVEDPPKRVRDYASAHWIVDDVAVSVLPAVSSLRELRTISTPSSADKPFLGIGNPVFAARGSDPGSTPDGCADHQFEGAGAIPVGLSSLPETVDELRAIADALGAAQTALLLGEQATEVTLKNADLSAYRGIAFATHGLLPSEAGCGDEPGLALTAPSSQSASDNGLLTASEIFSLSLDADWVLLSACNTGRVDGGFGGESLSSLAQGFFYSGARMVIASHWPVVSETTVSLTSTMLTGAQQTSMSEGLRRSQLAMLRDTSNSHPIYWAPFTIYGDGAR